MNSKEPNPLQKRGFLFITGIYYKHNKMAKKILRLTERDLTRLVKKVVNEQTKFSLDEPHYTFDRKNGMVALIEQTPKMVRRVLKNLPPNLQYLAIINCDFVDFEDIDMCSLNQLQNVNLIGTESNFEEQGYDCLNKWDERGQYRSPLIN